MKRKAKTYLELSVGVPKGAYLFNRVATDGIGEILFGVLEPGIEGGRFLGEREEQLLDLPELVLHT